MAALGGCAEVFAADLIIPAASRCRGSAGRPPRTAMRPIVRGYDSHCDGQMHRALCATASLANSIEYNLAHRRGGRVRPGRSERREPSPQPAQPLSPAVARHALMLITLIPVFTFNSRV